MSLLWIYLAAHFEVTSLDLASTTFDLTSVALGLTSADEEEEEEEELFGFFTLSLLGVVAIF